MEPDFSGYATKAGLKCSDGRTITPEAFKHMDKMQVPLVWQHGHSDPANVLGHAILEAKTDGVYAYGFFNGTDSGKRGKELVEHKDIKALSIFANQLVEKSKQVLHGEIREVSLVLAGANPGAKIDYVRIAHSDGEIETLDDEAVITTGLELEFGHAMGDAASMTPSELETQDAAAPEKSVQDIFDGMSSEQQDAVAYIVDSAVTAAKDPDGDGDDDAAKGVADDKAEGTDNAAHSDDTKTGEVALAHQEGTGQMPNVFETKSEAPKGHEMTHDAMQGIFVEAKKPGATLKSAVGDYAFAHGITPMDILFPNAQNISNTPQFNTRRMEWVPGVLNGCNHTPFSRVKTITADLTQDQARALGYIKGNYKKEEWFTVNRRSTGPSTVYKKQKLDRDDILDITDFNVVSWMQGEMRLMLEEEIARAILIGDGRAVDDDDKISDPMAAVDGAGIRSILNEHELFATQVYVNIDDASSSYLEVVEAIMRSMRFYKGTGTPVFYTTLPVLTSMLLTKDTLNRRLYANKADLASAMMVSDIVAVEAMESNTTLLGIVVNLGDYNIGADKGGEVSLFDFFDIDYNQYKYLIETRISGALTRIKSALVINKTAAANVIVVPSTPTFVKSTGVVTIPTKTGVVYKNSDTAATLTAGAQTALAAGATLNVVAVPASGYYFETASTTVEWSFTMPAA